MAKTTAIEWADATWNPWRGCKKVSAGCKNCYAERDMKRFGHDFNIPTRSKTTFRDPLKWHEPKIIFVCSWSDFFWEEVPHEWRDEAWEIMRRPEGSHHTYLLLTKRPENIKSMLPILGWPEGWPNVWLGVSAENQAMVDLRIPKLLKISAQVHFVSAEPLLGPINLQEFLWTPTGNFRTHDGQRQYQMTASGAVDWIITGGESDLRNPRPMESEWAFDIRDQCIKAGVSFFHKQHGGNRKIDGAWGGRVLDGCTWNERPIMDVQVGLN